MAEKTNYTTRIINYALKVSGFYPLRPMQLWLIDTHFNKAKSAMMNISVLYKYDDSIDLEKLAQAINDTCAAHDIFRTRFVFHEDTEDICQRFDGEITPVTVEKISDEEFEQRKKILLKPYKLINSPLYRIYLFETPSGKFVYYDVYHAIIDGMGIFFLFFRELEMRYKGKKITREPLQYADFILEELKISPEEMAEGNNYWHEMTAGFDEKKHLPPADLDNSKNTWQSKHFYIELENITNHHFADKARKENIFFFAASMLTIAKTAGAKSSIMSWIHNGRMNAQERRLMGIMIEQYPISWNFEKDLTVEQFLDELEIKMNTGMKYRRSLGAVYSEGLEDDCVTFIFQKGMRNRDSSDSFAGKKVEYVTVPKNKFSASENTLDIELNALGDGNYLVDLDYDASRYSENAMKNFAETFDEIVLELQDEQKNISEILGGR